MKKTKSNQASAIFRTNTLWNTILKPHRDEHERFVKTRAGQIEQFWRRSCLVISGIIPYHEIKQVERQKKQTELFLRELCVNEDDFDYELDKSYRLTINSTELTSHKVSPNIICKFGTYCFREQIYSQKKKKIYRSIDWKINFHVNLTKRRLNLLKESNSYIKNDERIKFCFPDSNGNLKVKFAENHDVSFDTFQSILTVLETKLASDENAYEEDNENNNAEKVEDDQ